MQACRPTHIQISEILFLMVASGLVYLGKVSQLLEKTLLMLHVTEAKEQEAYNERYDEIYSCLVDLL